LLTERHSVIFSFSVTDWVLSPKACLRHFWNPCKNKVGALLMHSLQMTLQTKQCMKLCKKVWNKIRIIGAPPMLGPHSAIWTAITLNTPFPSFSDSNLSWLLVHLLSSWIFLNPFFHLVHNSEFVLHIFVFHSLNVVHPVASSYLPPFYSVQNYEYFTFYILVVVISQPT
jgi:hypothetical protein